MKFKILDYFKFWVPPFWEKLKHRVEPKKESQIVQYIGSFAGFIGSLNENDNGYTQRVASLLWRYSRFDRTPPDCVVPWKGSWVNKNR